MTYRIYLSPPDVGPLEEEFVLDALRSGWVAPLGPHVEAFEAEIAEYVGVKHAVALSSGTAGLHLGLLALGVAPGDEVVVPTMTFAATAFAVIYVGARPVFIDSEPVSYNLDPELLAELLHDRARRGRLPAAVITVDVFGQTADYARIEAVCAEHNVPILEDAAEALGAPEVWVIRYPVTPTASVAVKVVMLAVSDVDVGGIAKAVTLGAVVSGRVMVTEALRFVETLPAASLAQA